jgi:hypothetical protein
MWFPPGRGVLGSPSSCGIGAALSVGAHTADVGGRRGPQGRRARGGLASPATAPDGEALARAAHVTSLTLRRPLWCSRTRDFLFPQPRHQLVQRLACSVDCCYRLHRHLYQGVMT